MDKLYIADKNNWEASGMSSFQLVNKLSNISTVIGGDFTAEEEDEFDHFSTLTEYALAVARRQGVLRNAKTLLCPLEDVHVNISLMLSNKDSSQQVQVSDVLETFSKVAKSQNVESYVQMNKAHNVVDVWQLSNSITGEEEKRDGGDILYFSPAMNLFSDKCPDGILLEKLLRHAKRLHLIEIESPLDSCINVTTDVSLQIADTEWDEFFKNQRKNDGKNDDDDDEDETTSTTDRFCQQLMASYCRLVVNSRDELSLARIVAATKNLGHAVFTEIKRESAKTKMPLYQTVVSYVQRLKLGGKSYAPSDKHPFAPHNKELTGMVDLMHKLQSRIEDEKTVENSVQKILHLLKAEISNKETHIKASCVERVTRHLLDVFGRIKKSRKVTDNMAAVRSIVDYLSAQKGRYRSVHVLLGKIADERLLLPPSSANHNKSPVVLTPNIVGLFKSPEMAVTKTSPKLSTTKSVEVCTPKSSKRGRPKYKSALAWANETSPVLPNSVEKLCPTRGVTLQVAAPENELIHNQETEREFLVKARLEAESCLKEAVEAKKMCKKAPRKRSIFKDISNVDKWAKMNKEQQQTSDKPSLTQEKRPKKRTHIMDDENQEAKKKKTEKPKTKKKTIEPIKGQTKMTSFLMRM